MLFSGLMKMTATLRRISSSAYQNMKAIRIHKFGGPEVLSLENDVVIPEIEACDILIRVHAAGINPVDTYIREGAFGYLPDLPAILGKDIAGTVENVGSDVTDFKKGDRVFGCADSGGYAEFAKCPKSHVFPLSDKLSFSQGALYCPYFTAYRALITKCKAKKGEILLIHGASGAVGNAAIQIGKALGLTVAGTAGTLEGMELVKKLGADHVFNHKEKGYLNNAVAAIGGHGFDVVLENLANVNLGADLTVLNQQARVAVVGNRGTVEINPRSLMLTESTIVGVRMIGVTPEEHLETANFLLAGIDEGWVSPVIAKEYLLEEAAEAHGDIINTKGARGKLVFKL